MSLSLSLPLSFIFLFSFFDRKAKERNVRIPPCPVLHITDMINVSFLYTTDD